MVSSVIYKAILSMDVYNRGYDAGINMSSDKLGTISIFKKTTVDGKLVNFDSSLMLDSNGEPLDSPISFYAIAYQTETGEKIISYRGTDDLVADFNTGFGVGAGSIFRKFLNKNL